MVVKSAVVMLHQGVVTYVAHVKNLQTRSQFESSNQGNFLGNDQGFRMDQRSFSETKLGGGAAESLKVKQSRSFEIAIKRSRMIFTDQNL